jgi:hypothetical protein
LAFKDYDRSTGFRRKFLARLSQELIDFVADGLRITLGGETSFDLVTEGNDKSFPLHSLLGEGFKHIWYVGDALFEGGNDGAVLKFIEQWHGPTPCPVEAIRVAGWRDTLPLLHQLGIVNAKS